MGLTATMSMQYFLEQTMRGLVNAGDMSRGFKDVVVTDQAGAEHTVRVGQINPRLAGRVLEQYTSSGDPRVLCRCVVAGEFGTDAFLDSLIAPDLVKLGNVAIAMALGPEKLRALFASGLQQLG